MKKLLILITLFTLSACTSQTSVDRTWLKEELQTMEQNMSSINMYSIAEYNSTIEESPGIAISRRLDIDGLHYQQFVLHPFYTIIEIFYDEDSSYLYELEGALDNDAFSYNGTKKNMTKEEAVTYFNSLEEITYTKSLIPAAIDEIMDAYDSKSRFTFIDTDTYEELEDQEIDNVQSYGMKVYGEDIDYAIIIENKYLRYYQPLDENGRPIAKDESNTSMNIGVPEVGKFNLYTPIENAERNDKIFDETNITEVI